MAVTLDPSAAAFISMVRLANRPKFETMSAAQARAASLAGRAVSMPDPPEVAEVRNLCAPGPAGAISLRLYRPIGSNAGEVLPGLVYFHGGGWVIGDLDSHDVVCRTIANESGRIVVAVDYRLAPEHKCPAAVEDAIAATRWIFGHARELDIDTAHFAVGGDSAGANLATVVCLHAREQGHPDIEAQVLIYPVTDLSCEHPSYNDDPGVFLMTSGTMRWFRAHYLADEAQARDWRVSPLLATNLTGLPPAFVLTAGADPLRDEGDAYARRLEAEGVAVDHRVYSGQFHGFLPMGKLLPESANAMAEVGAWLKKFE